MKNKFKNFYNAINFNNLRIVLFIILIYKRTVFVLSLINYQFFKCCFYSYEFTAQ
ncbi:hypothetical protein pb186bvf_000402 [Paramecium bursaria]